MSSKFYRIDPGQVAGECVRDSHGASCDAGPRIYVLMIPSPFLAAFYDIPRIRVREVSNPCDRFSNTCG